MLQFFPYNAPPQPSLSGVRLAPPTGESWLGEILPYLAGELGGYDMAGSFQRGRAPSGAPLPMPKTIFRPGRAEAPKAPPKAPSKTEAVPPKPSEPTPPPFAPLTPGAAQTPPPSTVTGPALTDVPTPKPGFVPGTAPDLQMPEAGTRQDFDARQAELMRMAQEPRGFKQAFIRGMLSNLAPGVVQAQDRSQAAQIELAQRALQAEQARSDADFSMREEMKNRLYLSEAGSRIGRQYGTTEGGISGFFSPAELENIRLKEEELAMQKATAEGMIPYRRASVEALGAQADAARANAEYTRSMKGPLAEAGAEKARAASLLNYYSSNPMAAMEPGAQENVNWALGVLRGGGAPSPAAAPAPTLSPTAQKVLQAGLPMELAQRWDVITKDASSRQRALQWIQSQPFTPEQKKLIGQLLNER